MLPGFLRESGIKESRPNMRFVSFRFNYYNNHNSKSESRSSSLLSLLFEGDSE